MVLGAKTKGNYKYTISVFCLFVLVMASGCGKAPVAAAPAPEVVVVQPVQRDVPVGIDLVGQAQGHQDIEIRARVEGFLQSVNFDEGAFVKKGTLLYQIDPKTFQADLADAQAKLTKTSNDITRFRPLVAKQAVSQQELDNAVSAHDAAKAQFDMAKLKLGYATITSPIDGVVGITSVKPGSLVGRGESTHLTTVSEVDPIVFKVGISEAEYLRFAKNGAHVARENLDIELLLSDGAIYDQKGVVDAVDRGIDANTGTLAVQFSFPNPKRLIRPGQYGRVHVVIENLPSAILVPQRAVKEIQGLYQLAVVDANNKVSMRMVKVGPRVDDQWVITEGLQASERVIVEGLQRARDGITVSPKLEADTASPKTAPVAP